MNRLLEEQLEILNNNKAMLQAVEKIFKEQIKDAKPSTETGDSNDVLGQKFRAYEKAEEILNNAILEIKSYKKETHKEEVINKAR